MSLLSQECRREPYIVIVPWKISKSMVNGYQVLFYVHLGKGRLIGQNQLVKAVPSKVRKARDCSLAAKDAKIFNLLPYLIRNMDSDDVNLFKHILDFFLSSIPDKPTVRGSLRGAEKNSLLYQIPLSRMMK